MTGSMKYAIRQTFMIETGDDPDKDQQDERKSASVVTTKFNPSGWPQPQIIAMLETKAFANVFEFSGAIKYSKVMKPGVPTPGLLYWIEEYKKCRVVDKLEPAKAAEIADEAYLAEKARKDQDKSTGA
jgi:hypothetical protein